MFDIKRLDDGRVALYGRLDASSADAARDFLSSVQQSCTLDFGDLEYISSAGLGVLLGTQKRLGLSGNRITLTNVNEHIKDVFEIAGFNRIIDIE